MSVEPVHPVVRIRSDGRRVSSVILVAADGSELDVSNVVTSVTWRHDAQDQPRVLLELVPDADVEVSGFLLHLSHEPAPS